MGKERIKIFAAILAALLSIPSVFVLSLWYFHRMVQAGYASGERVSTDGDTAMIPAAQATTTWIALLLAIAATLLVIRIVRKGRRRAAVEQAVAADDPAAGKSE